MSATTTCRLPPQLERLTVTGLKNHNFEGEDRSRIPLQWPPTLQHFQLAHGKLEHFMVELTTDFPTTCTFSHKQTVLLRDRPLTHERWQALAKLQGRFETLEVELCCLTEAKAAVLAASMKPVGGESGPTLTIT